MYVPVLNRTLTRHEVQGPLHKTMVTLQLMVSPQTIVTTIDFLTLIGYGAVLLW